MNEPVELKPAEDWTNDWDKLADTEAFEHLDIKDIRLLFIKHSRQIQANTLRYAADVILNDTIDYPAMQLREEADKLQPPE